MAAPHINYTSQKRFLNITSNSATLVTNCTSISIQNKGEVAMTMTVEDTLITLKPGEDLTFSNDPDVLEETVYTNLEFADVAGEKFVFVIKEFINPVSSS